MAPQSLSYFYGAFNWQVRQAGFLIVFSVQFDGEKADKITRGACACNDDRVIFEDPLNWTTWSFIFAKQGESVAGQRINALLHFQERCFGTVRATCTITRRIS